MASRLQIYFSRALYKLNKLMYDLEMCNMKKFFLSLSVFLVVALAFSACTPKNDEPDGPEEPQKAPEQNGSGETDGYVLVWEDLFDNGVLNEDDWNIEVNGNGGGNNELQYYRRENISFETDEASLRKCLVITAKREKELFNGKNFTSGRLNTKNKVAFQKGKFEAMIKMPNTYQGLWPAFWAMGNNYDEVGWPACGEFDILEMGHSNGFKGGEDTAGRYFNGAFHWGPKWDQHMSYSYSTTYGYNLQDGEFHLFTWIWDENSCSCYVDLDKYPDVKPYFTIDISEVNLDDNTVPGNYLQVPYFLIFNLAVGGNFPGIYDADGITALNEENNYEASMWVDYVRIYQKSE